MIKLILTNVVISNGYNGVPALRYSENGNSVRFRVGSKVYDTRAENNTRWINLSVKAFDHACERIKSMKLKEGSFVNLFGRMDQEIWTDKETNEQKSQLVLILEDAEYAAGGGGKKENQTSGQSQNGGTNASAAPAPAASTSAASAPAASAAPAAESGNFTGYEPFGGGSLFDEN